MKNYRVKFNYHTYVEVEVCAKDEEEAYDIADSIVCREDNEEVSDAIMGNLVQMEREIEEI